MGRQFAEKPDNTPVALPLNYKKPETLHETIARVLRYESIRAQSQGFESDEEADDFDVDDNPDGAVFSNYQLTEMQEEAPLRRKEKTDGKPALSAQPSETPQAQSAPVKVEQNATAQ